MIELSVASVVDSDGDPFTSIFDLLVHGPQIPEKSLQNTFALTFQREGNAQEAVLLKDMEAKGVLHFSLVLTYSTLVEGPLKSKDFSGTSVWCREMVEKGFIPRFNICNELITGLRDEGKLQQVELLRNDL
ncbi:hypothetical protein IFM89_015268 [Coptis chinensis]|uniref:Uncharacterized protein n=1 Tax=Coptis chinensis TaxID=261450 RepID=A0A835HF12_9MAGN|nr:hypothetical protein IFM89_015268 [Coptis chinensis]